MRHYTLTFILLLAAAFGFMSSKPAEPPVDEAFGSAPLKWYTFEEAVALSRTKPKKIMIDIYTDWCGWCKRMDKTTFTDQAATAYIQENFYPVKLDAEQRTNIVFGRDTFKYVDLGNGGRGINTLAYSLLEGKLGYPALVYLDEQFRRIMISPGYKEAPDLLKELKFAAEEHYNTTTWEEYNK